MIDLSPSPWWLDQALNKQTIWLWDTDLSREHLLAVLAVLQELHYDESVDSVTMDINTNGGGDYPSMALASYMLSLREDTEFIIGTHVSAAALSCGSVIAACGTPGHRIASPYSQFLVHGIVGQVGPEAVVNLRGDVEAYESRNRSFCEILEVATGTGFSVWEDMLLGKGAGVDHWLSAEQAQGLGIIDRIEHY